MARPKLILTAARRKKIAKAVGEGLSQKAAFTLAGINGNTGAKWIREGKDDIANGKADTDKAKLVTAIEEARSALEDAVIKKITIIDTKVDAFTFLKYLREQEEKRENREKENAGGMGGYTPPQVGNGNGDNAK